MSRKKKIEKLTLTVVSIFVLIGLLIYLFPIIWSVISSFKTGSDTFAIPPKIIFKPTLEAYRYVIEEMNILYYFFNSLIISGLSTIIAIFVSIFSAYAIARFNWKSKENTAFLILTFKMMPPIAVIIPMYLIYRTVEEFLGIHLIDTRIGLILLYLFFNIPFSVWILRSFFEKIPSSIEESALIDGCGRFKAIIRIIIPMARPGIVSAAFFSLIFSWNEFLFALIITDTNARTLPVEIGKLIGFRGILWNQMGAVSLFSLIPMMIFAVFARNYLAEGLTSGSLSN